MPIEPNATNGTHTDFVELEAPALSRRWDLEQRGPNGRARNPLVTIAIPTRNRALIVGEAVKKALAQSYSNIEVLVSDNASTDDTLTTLKSITDPRLHILTSREDIGANANYSKCIREAKGDFLLIVPDDDWISGAFVEKCVDLLNEEPGIQAVVAAYGVFFADENRDRPAMLSQRLPTGIWEGSEILKEVLRGQFSAAMLSTVFRTEFLRSNGGWPSKYQTADDPLTLSRILLSGRAGLLNERCATLVIRNRTISSGLSLCHHLAETQEVMEVVSDIATRAIPDEASRSELQELTARYAARKLFDCLALYRRQGAALREVGRQLRIWRRQSRQCTLAHFVAALKFKTLALLLLPAPLTRLLLSLRETLQARVCCRLRNVGFHAARLSSASAARPDN
jgi:glycosyltransferase involved in cell wall biosynthesis